MKRGLLTGIAIALLLSVLPGCWDLKQIDKRLMPIMMAVDITENKTYRVSLRLPDPQIGKITQAVEREAPTISEALDRMRIDEQRSIELLHLSLILVSEALAKEGMKELIEYAVRTRAIPSKALFAVFSGNVHRFMSSKTNMKLQDGTELLDFFNKQAGWTPNTAIAYTWSAYRNYHAHTEDMIFPIVKEGTDTMLKFVGSAVMDGDRMTGEISTDETLLYNLFQNEFKGGIVEVTNRASLEIAEAHASRKAVLDGKTPRVDCKINISAVVLETKVQIPKDELQKELASSLEARFSRLFEKLHRANSDPLQTGQLFRSKLTPEQIRTWKEQLYPKLEMNVRIQADIRNNGNLKM